MVTVSAYLHPRANKQGLHPIAIRITLNRKSSYVFTGQCIAKEQWDKQKKRVKKNHPNSNRINSFITKKLNEVNKKYIELDIEEKPITSASKLHEEIQKTHQSQSFNVLSEAYLENLKKEGKYNRISSEKSHIKHFKEFLNKDISLDEITVSLLNKYKAWLKNTGTKGSRTVMNHLVVIRGIFSQAIKSGVIDQKYYPFGRDKVPIKFPESIKIGLTQHEVKQLETLDLSAFPTLNHARNVWLFSFYFAGMRVSDVLRTKWSDFKDDRFFYAMGKNEKGGSLKVSDKVLQILSQYRSGTDSSHDLVFPDLKGVKNIKDKYEVQKKMSSITSTLNKRLKRIAVKMKLNKKLTMHIARHTFGNLSGDKIPIQMLQKLYRHSSVTTTINYQANFMFKDGDEALEKVTGF